MKYRGLFDCERVGVLRVELRHVNGVQEILA